MGNPAPRFVIPDAQIVHRSVMKEKHIKVVLTDASGKARLNAVAMAFMTTRPADQPGVMAEHGYVTADRSRDGGKAMRGPMSPP